MKADLVTWLNGRNVNIFRKVVRGDVLRSPIARSEIKRAILKEYGVVVPCSVIRGSMPRKLGVWDIKLKLDGVQAILKLWVIFEEGK